MGGRIRTAPGLVLVEGVLRAPLAYLVYQHMQVAAVRHYAGQVVPFSVPGHHA